MIAPCGIEIKVGQVWKSVRGFLWHVIEIDEPFRHARVSDYRGKRKHYIAQICFTNLPGGYTLFKDV